ncbi:hypothetical protein DY000_02021977 [Brassica cretica]|uniref:Uncharacterized protein n=1 Tax=Brassica cretica TaxID=69181 RepID=A0ABQ7EMF7_BRACR|nr:hypothetical protein DY000_02021977 [Brassica cretica]
MQDTELEKDKLIQDVGLHQSLCLDVVADADGVRQCSMKHAEWWGPCGCKKLSWSRLNFRNKFIPWR